jgi:NAD(P)-dependent dehydrogenase (short-subunit alcohol dehydrogenase family)
MLLEGKVALVTGSASGIGRACALRMAREGARIAVSDIDVSGGEETVRLIEGAGGEAIFVQTNVVKASEVEALVQAAVDAFGGLDIAVNNAGVGGNMGNADQLEEGDWDFVMDVNVKGVWLCTKYEIPRMLERGGGSIINVASLAGLAGFRGNAAYAASKHAVIGFTKSVALEHAREGIRVNAICPGFTETPMVAELVDAVPRMAESTRRSSPMRRLGRPEEVADTVLFLASDMSSFINGHALAIDGGAAAQ